MPSRKLDDLTPECQEKAVAFIGICGLLGIKILVTCTLRSNEEQQAIWDQGRTKPGKIVTNARPGQSKHNPDSTGKSRALDVAFLLESGDATWEGPWERLGIIASLVGLKWGGNFVSFKDYPHFEV